MLDDAGGDFRGLFPLMIIAGMVFSIITLVFMPVMCDEPGVAWFAVCMSGLLLGAGFGLWAMDG